MSYLTTRDDDDPRSSKGSKKNLKDVKESYKKTGLYITPQVL